MGIINSAFGFAAFAALQLSLGSFVHYLWVLCLAHVAAVLEAFFVQRRFVFRSRRPWLPELARFWSVYLGILAVNIPLLLLLVKIGRVPVLPAQFCILVALAFGSYAIHRSFTFLPTGTGRVTAPGTVLAPESHPTPRRLP